MPKRRLSYLLMTLLLFASVAFGCRAPYPSYNPYGFYGQPCVNPPGTGTYNPATGRTDPYYGVPNNGVYPPNPYAPYPGYPPAQQPAGSTSKRTWTPQASTDAGQSPTVEETTKNTASLVTSSEGQWQSVNNPNRDQNRAVLDTGSTFDSPSSRVAASNVPRFDGFGRN